MSQVEIAQTLLKEAEKACTTSFLRWKPDWEKAERSYNDAAKAFGKAGNSYVSQRVLALKGAAKAAEEMSILNKAARYLEQAAYALVSAGQLVESIDLSRGSASLYQQNGQARKASSELAKAASSMRDVDDDLAVELYLKAIDILEIEEQEILGNDTYKAVIALLVRRGRFKQAIIVFERQNNALKRDIESYASSVFKNFLSIVILCLAQSDVQQATQKFEEHSQQIVSFSSSNEFAAAQSLLHAFQASDESTLEKVKANRTFNYIDNQVTRIVKKLAISDASRQTAAITANSVDKLIVSDDEELDLT